MMTLNVTTDQEAFDKVVRHLATLPMRNMAQRTDGHMVCSYLGVGCAIGVLIDEFDGPDTYAVTTLVTGRDGSDLLLPPALDIGDVTLTMLQDLQQVHDTLQNWDITGRHHPVGFWAWYKLEDIAKFYGLDTAALEEVRRDRPQ